MWEFWLTTDSGITIDFAFLLFASYVVAKWDRLWKPDMENFIKSMTFHVCNITILKTYNKQISADLVPLESVNFVRF